MKELAPRRSDIHIDLKGRHPDDGLSGDLRQGSAPPQRIEELFGAALVDSRIPAGRSTTTDSVVKPTCRGGVFAQDGALAAQSIDLLECVGAATRWRSPSRIEGPRRGRPQIERWRRPKVPADLETRGWVTQQWLHFLERVSGTLDADRWRS